MSRNTDNHFGLAPSKSIGRSSFKRPHSHKTTFNTGDIVPIYADEVLPGDTCKMHTASLVRMTTPINPVMDNAWMDTYYFFVPRRLVWEHWKEFMGENTTDAWTQEIDYQIPQLTTPEGGWTKGTVGEKLYGIQSRSGSVDACYARAFTLIYNEWFRNENVIEPAEVSLGDSTTAGSNGTDYVTDLQKGGALPKAGKYADYFTRALPEPQKGPDVYIPLGTKAPVDIDDTYHELSKNNFTVSVRTDRAAAWVHNSGGNPDYYPNGSTLKFGNNSIDGTAFLGESGYAQPSPATYAAPDNLYTDLSKASAATINQLRQAFAVQRLFERDALGGRAKACASY